MEHLSLADRAMAQFLQSSDVLVGLGDGLTMSYVRRPHTHVSDDFNPQASGQFSGTIVLSQIAMPCGHFKSNGLAYEHEAINCPETLHWEQSMPPKYWLFGRKEKALIEPRRKRPTGRNIILVSEELLAN